ncbi:MAG: metallophosphoesterase family protein [Clostridia bacterium]|nr:metallophosphoesterase family protein [Clostridia bacterium]
MKILALADHAEPKLWEHLDRRLLEGVDLVISCGDLPPSYLSFLTCFTHAPVLYVHGNHDARYEKTPPEGCVCIDGEIYDHEGVRIVGLGGSMCYIPDAPHQYTEREMARRLRRLRFALFRKGGADILVTHAPALGVGDDKDLAHRGFGTFLRFMDRYHPRYMLHGHVHIEYTHDFKRERRYGDTTVVNACGAYFIEIDAPDRGKTAPRFCAIRPK